MPKATSNGWLMASECEDCVQCRRVTSGRGSEFLFCEQSKTDKRFPKYPGQPVRNCAGYVRRETSTIQAVLFDMGGVVIQLQPLESVLGASGLSRDEIWKVWILSDAVQAFETGKCSVEGFATAVVKEFSLPGTPSEFIERFKRFPQGLFPGAVEMVAAVPDNVVKGVLSNTNALHWDNQTDHEIVRGLFDREYLSYAMGLAKPEREIFDHAVADLGIDASQVLFIDDNPINVDGAKAAGLQAGLAKGPVEATQVLETFGVIR